AARAGGRRRGSVPAGSPDFDRPARPGDSHAVARPDRSSLRARRTAMSLAYPSAVRRRSRVRKILDTFEGYIRIDLVEERMFPASTILRYLAVVFPVLLYYFMSTFLSIS